jgi:hypothetical protein
MPWAGSGIFTMQAVAEKASATNRRTVAKRRMANLLSIMLSSRR